MWWEGFQYFRQFTLRGTLLSLGFVLVCHCDVRIARASCGNYLLSHGHTIADEAHAIPGRKPMSDPYDSHTPACSGPQCQRGNPVPVIPAREANLSPAADAILAATLRLSDIAGLKLRPHAADHVTTGEVDRLLRPPCAGGMI